jgi:hypothetical protein
VVFPELLRGVFSGDAGEDLLATCAPFHRQLLRPWTIGMKSGGDKYPDAHPGRSSDHRHPRRRQRIDHSPYYGLRRLRLRMFSSLCRFCRLCVTLSIQSIAKAQNKEEIYDIVKIGRKEGRKGVRRVIIKFRFHVRIHFHMCSFFPAPDHPPRISWFQELLHTLSCVRKLGGFDWWRAFPCEFCCFQPCEIMTEGGKGDVRCRGWWDASGDFAYFG